MRLTHALLLIAFAGISAVLYYPALHGEFIMDDWGYITANSWVTEASAPWRFWTTFAQTDYWPLTYTFYWLFFKAFGENPFGYHLINIFMHALNGVLIFTLATRFKLRWPIWVALLFLVHPLHVQAVAWIVQFKTLLSTALALASLLTFQSYLDGKGRKHFALAILAFALALLAKTSVIFLPFVFLGLMGNRPRHRWASLAPFFALALIGGLVTLHVNHLNFNDRQADVFHMSFAERLLVIVQNLIFYPKVFFAPFGLSYMYPLRVPEIYGHGLYLIPAGILAAILLGFVAFYKPWRGYRFFILSYFALLIPCLGVVAIPNMKLSLVADHWAYLPDIFLVMFLGRLAQVPDTSLWRGGLMVPVALLAGLTFVHAGTFASEEAFWQRARVMNPHHAAPYYNLGVVYGKQDKVDASIDQYKFAIQRDLTHHRAWFNLGRAFFIRHEYEKAEECFLHALKINPKLVSGYLALSSTYQKVGSPDQAVKAVEDGLKENPDDRELTARLVELKN